MGPAYREHGLVFAREDGSPIRPSDLSELFGRLVAETAMPDGSPLRPVRFHDLRLGAASLMLAAGVDIAIVSKRLGHSQIGVTVDSYAHLLRGVGQDAAERAAALVPRGPRDQSVTNRVGRPVQPNGGDSRGEGVGAVHGRVDRLGVGGAGGTRTHDLTDYESAALTS